MNRMRTGLLVAILIGFVSVGLSGPVLGSIDKCQKAISKENQKLEAKMVKALNKCADNYQKAVKKGDPLSTITGKCNDALGKVFDIGNPSSTIAKAQGKLAGLVPGEKCDDADLEGLGHLSEALFGDKWQRLVLIAAWKTAYENATLSNADLGNIFQEMVDAGGCPLCSLVSSPPCHNHTCILGPGSGGPVNTVLAGVPSTIATTNLTGATPISTCYVPSILGTGEYGIVSGAGSKGILPVLNLLPGVHVCVTSFRAEGYVNCIGPAGSPRVNTDMCVDHLVQDLGGVFADECETGAPTEVCQPRLPDTDHVLAPNEVNGGVCLNLTTSPAALGEAFFLSTTRVQVVLAGEVGGDGIACTADDNPATITAASTIPQTTGQATSRVIDSNAQDAWPDITVGPISGIPFNCAQLFTGSTSGGKTVSAAAALHGLPGPLDSGFSTTLICQ